jgi:hypothetical protein
LSRDSSIFSRSRKPLFERFSAKFESLRRHESLSIPHSATRILPCAPPQILKKRRMSRIFRPDEIS